MSLCMKKSLKYSLLLVLLTFNLLSCDKDGSRPKNNNAGDSNIYSKPKISVTMTKIPESILPWKLNNISALIKPRFNAELGEHPALVAEVTVRELVSNNDTSTPSVPLFRTECFEISDTTKTKRVSMPGKVTEASAVQITNLTVDSKSLETGIEYRSETAFVGSQIGATVIIKMYGAILSKDNEILVKSEEFNKTYVVQ